MIRVLRQRNWTDAELQAAQFHYYDVRKRLVMVKVLDETIDIQITLEILKAGEGDIICYAPGSEPREDLDDYDHWPVRRDLFRQNYRAWNEPGWKPNPAEFHLITCGCRPYYKKVGIWAQRLTRHLYVQSLESARPVLIPPGRWLCIGVQGEPYHMNDREFRNRYIVPEDAASLNTAL